MSDVRRGLFGAMMVGALAFATGCTHTTVELILPPTADAPGSESSPDVLASAALDGDNAAIPPDEGVRLKSKAHDVPREIHEERPPFVPFPAGPIDFAKYEAHTGAE